MSLTRIQNTWLGTYAAEMLFFVFKVAESMLEPTIRLYILDSVCHKTFPDTDTCRHLSESASAEHTVQRAAASYLMYYKLLLNLPAMLIVLFCGAWSDHAGRKLPVIITCFGSILAVLLYMLSAYVTGRVPFLPLVLLGAGLRGVFGRSAIMTMSLHSYVSDISSRELRTKKISCLAAMSHFGYLTGCMVAGGMLEVFGFQLVFTVVIGLQTICVLVALLCMREKLPISPPDTTDSEDSDDVEGSDPACKMAHLKDCLGVLLRRRKGQLRKLFIVAFFIMIIHQTCKSGEMDITLLYVSRPPLNWRKSVYGYFLGVDYACLGFTAFFVLPLLIRCFALHDLTLIAIGLSCKVARMLIMTFVDRTWLVYFAAVVGGPNSFAISGVKSLISKTVLEDELGKTFSLLSCGETMSNLAGSVIFNNLYSATMDIFPGLGFVVEGVLYFTLLLTTLFTIAIRKRRLKQKREGLLRKDRIASISNRYGTLDKTTPSREEVVVTLIEETDGKDSVRGE